MYIHLADDGSITSVEPHIDNPSEGPFGPLGPFDQYNSFTVAQDPGSGDISVEWSLLNGYAGAARTAHDIASSYAGSSSWAERFVGGVAEVFTGVALGAIDAFGMNETIDGQLSLSAIPQSGVYELASMNSDPYPSIEIYYYVNGTPLYSYASPEWPRGRPDIGLRPEAPRRIFPD